VECNKNCQTRWENVEQMEKLTYRGSGITRDGGTEIDVKTN
jgi:hypothetical protein